ncbi:ATP-binding cassette sub-family A member 2 [Orchesella cincta]|uniref:ATP-binding cassette sub-family A member 2 n=1 Tax=Orchesella cincta TaxID=48709 RepID=A0A1D2N549_ORCCI|nr:ATP-binding cassette sub-family A member 2 [Orchesella cincta]
MYKGYKTSKRIRGGTGVTNSTRCPPQHTYYPADLTSGASSVQPWFRLGSSYKSFYGRTGNIIRLVIEILWPLALFLILMWVRTRGLKYRENSCHVVEKALPSVGGFEFLQNYLCTLNNTCYEDYVENTDERRWDDALLVKFIRETTPMLKDILGSEESRSTVVQGWALIMDYFKIISSLQVTENLYRLGSFQLRDLLTPEGLKQFRSRIGIDDSLSSEDVEGFLNVTVHIKELHQETVSAILDDFRNGKCELNKTYDLVSFPNEKTFETLCKMDRSSAFTLLFVYNNYLDRAVEIKMAILNKITETEEQLNQRKNELPMQMLQFDFTTIGKIGQLGRKFLELGRTVRGFNDDNLTSAEIGGAVLYEGLCGIKLKGEQTLFRVDAGDPNRYDSLRDRLKDWNPDHHYENDPDISESCNSIFKRLESMPISSVVWRQIKPIVRGYIYYAPDTPATRLLMEKVEEKFMQFQDLESSINLVVQLVHRVRLWMRDNMEALKDIKVLLGKRQNIETLLRVLEVPADGPEVDRIYNIAESLGALNIENTLERIDFASEIFSELLGCILYNKTKPFPTEWEAVDAGHKLLSAEKLWAVINEEGNDTDVTNATMPPHMYYKIRMDSDKVDSTRSVRDRLLSKGPRRRPLFDLKYITYGFVYLQELIERSFIELVTGEDLSNEHVYLQQHPYPCYLVDKYAFPQFQFASIDVLTLFIRAVSRTLPLFMVLSWVYASAMIIKSIVLEKERRLREVMKIMGVSRSAVWTSWFIESFVIMLVSSTILTCILKYGKVIEFSDPVLIWVFLVSYTVATICFSFLVSTFFSRANSSAAAGGVIFFISYLPYQMMLVWEEQLKWFETLAGCLISNVAFGFGCTYLARYEEDGVGAQWDKLTWQTLPEDPFSLAYCIVMMWVDAVVYLVLTWYIETVFPGEYGVPRPWNFFLKSSYWVPMKRTKLPPAEEYANSRNSNGDIDPGLAPFVRIFNDCPDGIETEPDGLQYGVKVVNLCKTYPNGKVALENLNIKFYEDQITSFLGHNGAGKTTTISILTGLFPPTNGTAVINDMDIRYDIDQIRTNLGICPQFNVLFDRLTVYEHLKFYALLKGKKGKEVEKEFDEMLHDLDSVTSGVDPYSRKSIWELLLKYKKGRTVILTTHFMDEADILGDRIAIISQGKLKALGSSLFLKSHYGQGYTLHVVKSDNFSVGSRPSQYSLKAEKAQEDSMNHDILIEKSIREVVPETVMTENVGSEVAFLLPYTAVEQFSTLFTKLNENLNTLGILSYGISDTSLEDVFLKITADDLAANADSFHALSSNYKRRFMKMINCCKDRFAHGHATNAVVALNPPERAPSENTTATYVTRTSAQGDDGDFNVQLSDSSSDRTAVKWDEESNMTISDTLGRRTGDFTYQDTVTVTTSLLDESAVHVTPSPDRSILSWIKKLKCGSVLSCLCCSCLAQIYMIIRKRLWNSKRNKKAMFFEIILPAVFIAVTLAFTLILPPVSDEQPREVTPWAYPSPNYIFFSEPNRTRRRGVPSQFKTFVNELVGPIGMGTACLTHKPQGNVCNEEKWNNEAVQNFNVSRLQFGGAKFDNCTCDIGTFQCPASVNKVEFPTLKTPTSDYLFDVSNTNIPEWILKTYNKFLPSRYGGFELQLRKPGGANMALYLTLLQNFTNLIPLPDFDRKNKIDQNQFSLEEIEASSTKLKMVYRIWFENRGWLSSVSYLNALHNIWLRSKLPANMAEEKNFTGITLITHPMNLTKSQGNKESLKTAGLGVVHAICIIFALSFIPASFTVYLIEERKCGGKHLHLISGVRPITYWIANFLFDIGKYLVPIALCLFLFYLFDAKAYIGAPSFWSFLCLLLLYGWASIPSMYPFSFLFGVPSTAFVVLACSNLFIGIITTVSTFVLEQFGDEELMEVGKVLKKVFLIFPHYCLGRGCIELVRLDVENTALNVLSLGTKKETNRFAWEFLGEKLFWLGIHGIVYFLFNLCCEYRHIPMLMCKLLPSKQMIPVDDEDIDVTKERERVEKLSNDSRLKLQAVNLTKYYKGKKHPAVNGITMGIGKGECFGLLGVNGAGKTSTFKMLTGDVRVSSGNAKICGCDVETSLDQARKHFGYCPQEDSIDPLLTGYELLTLYGRLRGLNSRDTQRAAEQLIKTLDVLFLDEPTTGMDPGARRDLWKVILALLRKGKAVVLTSHSMEECEVLCTKIAIMVNGQFSCVGPLQHLKNRFGKGYTVSIRCEEKNQSILVTRLSADLPFATLEDQHCSQLKFNIPQESANLSIIFTTLSGYKTEKILEDYSVSQTTLDDIFVKFASHQKDSLDR